MAAAAPALRPYDLPPNEEERLRALYELDFIGAGHNEQIDRVCTLARDLFRVPIALVTLIERDRQCFLASCGLDLTETRREDAFCNLTILSDEPLVVEDTARDLRFSGNVFVCGPPNIRFYAGAPLKLRPGINIGTLCLVDVVARRFGPEDKANLAALADLIVSEIRGHRAERDLCASRTRMAQTARMAKVGGWELNLPSDTLIWEEGLYHIYGIPPGSPPAHDLILSRYDPPMRGKSRRRLNALFTTGRPYDVELRGTRPNGEVFWVRAMAEAEFTDGEVTRVIGAVQDITERKLAEERIRELAYRDPLTGLPNRASFIDKLARSVEITRRNNDPFALLKFNIDYFRDINDALGHQHADLLLQRVANELSEKFAALGAVARIGGDEFAVILRERNAVAKAPRLAEEFLERAKRRFRNDNASLPLGLSAGLVIFPEHGDDTELIMKNARLALFQAKAQGRGSVVLFNPAMRVAIDETNDLLRRIWRGIANREFVLHYQPIVRLLDGKVSGLEALMRWDDPQHGVLTPGHFLIGFEKPELALSLGDIALELATAQMREWLDQGVEFGSVALNLSTAQFRRGNLAERILGTLSRANVPPQRLTLEVTENVYMGWGADVVAQTVRKLHAAGVGIALDDFGTGYASLTHLRKFPIDKLKIDKSFVQSIESAGIVDAVINMGLSLSMQVVAEGVESAEQLSLLRMKGCDYVQGYIFSKPIAPDVIPDFISDFNAADAVRRPAANG